MRDTLKAMTGIEPNQIYLIEVKEQSLTVATLVTLAMKFRPKKRLTIGKYSCLCSNLLQVIVAAKENGNDLIAINATSEKEWYDIFGENYTEYILKESDIAVVSITHLFESQN